MFDGVHTTTLKSVYYKNFIFLKRSDVFSVTNYGLSFLYSSVSVHPNFSG